MTDRDIATEKIDTEKMKSQEETNTAERTKRVEKEERT